MAQPSVSNDLWDVSQGTVVTGSSDILPGYSAAAMFGEFGQNNGFGLTWTYFNDNQPAGTVHYVEWETPGDVKVGRVRLHAFGDGPSLNNGREFNQVTIKAKSADSSDYDITVLTFTPSHPYTYIDAASALIVDELIPAVTSRSFRAEFVQYQAGNGWDGPRIVEMDAFPVPPPQITQQPQSAVVNFAMPVVFSVQATGAGTLHYQWFRDGLLLEGKTLPTLRINSATALDQGAYSVSVTDDNSTAVAGPATLTLDFLNVHQSSADLWDVNSGVIITASSGYLTHAGTPEGMFGRFSADWESHLTYFADNQPTGTVHSVEWTIPSPASVRTLRLFAYGDPFLNNGREFDSLTVRAKSAGSSVFDVVVVTFKPSHPYTFLDGTLILDLEIPPIVASAFRAEFTQYTAGNGFDGPRIVEFDAFETRPLLRPTVISSPESQTLPKNSTVLFKVLARGGSLGYQWKFMGQNINGATSDSLQLKHVKAKNQGYYTVEVSNPAGSVTSTPALLLIAP